MKNRNQIPNPVVERVKGLLFASLFMKMGDVVQTSKALDKRPEKSDEIHEMLLQMMDEELPKYKEVLTFDELKEAVSNRVEEWTKSIGTPSMKQYASLSKCWGIPIDEIIKEKITPKTIYDLLDCFMVGQQEYKRCLSLSFYYYLMKRDFRAKTMSLPKGNLFVCGHSGSGKTLGIQIVASYFGVPVIVINSSTLVPEGIMGNSIPDYFTEAWKSAKGETEEEKIEYLSRLIICFDEFDKSFQSNRFGNTIVNEMLCLTDDNGVIRFRKTNSNLSDFITIPTRQMMFVFMGVFEGIDKTNNGGNLGFRNAEIRSNKGIEPNDLVKFGIKPELVGRIQNYTTVERLSADNLYELLDTKMDSPLIEFANYFCLNGIELTLTPEAKMLLAEIAYERDLGARGIKGLLNSILDDAMFSLSGNRLEIDRDYVKQHIN